MTDISVYYQNAQLAMAAYAINLKQGESGSQNRGYVDKLQSAGMSQSQAELFADTYSVVDQYEDLITGLSATVFSDASGNKYLAICGTQLTDPLDWLFDISILNGLVVGNTPPQYIDLELYYQQLVGQGLITGSETLTGKNGDRPRFQNQ